MGAERQQRVCRDDECLPLARPRHSVTGPVGNGVPRECGPAQVLGAEFVALTLMMFTLVRFNTYGCYAQAVCCATSLACRFSWRRFPDVSCLAYRRRKHITNARAVWYDRAAACWDRRAVFVSGQYLHRLKFWIPPVPDLIAQILPQQHKRAKASTVTEKVSTCRCCAAAVVSYGTAARGRHLVAGPAASGV